MEALVLDAEVTSMFHSDNTRLRKYHLTVIAINGKNVQAFSLPRKGSEACFRCNKKRFNAVGRIPRRIG